MNIPMWKVLPGLMTQIDKFFVIAQFGQPQMRVVFKGTFSIVCGCVDFITALFHHFSSP
jgi:hypothetical protein